MTPLSKLTSQEILQRFDTQLHAQGGMVYQEAPLVLDKLDLIHESANAKKRTVSGVASVEEISRSRHLFQVKGIDLQHFKQNPVVLACHQQCNDNLMPGAIGFVEKISKRDDGKTLVFRNMTFDTDPLAEAWWQKVSKGIVRMVSIGAWPLEWELGEEVKGTGKNKTVERFVDIIRSELVEISVVPIGANRGAIIDVDRPSAGQSVDDRLIKLESAIAELCDELTFTQGFELYHDGTRTQGFGDASWPDASFIVEEGAPREGERTEHRFRHLPHHRKTVKSPTENGTVDLPHLRNALARLGQVKPHKEGVEAFRKRARKHLDAHARVLLKSRREEVVELERIVADSDQELGDALDELIEAAQQGV